MKNVYIYGAGWAGKKLLDFIRENSCNIKIKGFIDKNKTGFIDDFEIFNINNVPTNESIIIAIKDWKIAVEAYRSIYNWGFRDIWWFDGNCNSHNLNDLLFDCGKWEKGAIYQVEMHISDACNLNCRGCAHFSPIFDTKLPDFEDRIKDVKKLKSKFSFIKNFYILGGEPFLNNEIGDYAIQISKILPDTKLWIVTNGLLIPKVTDEILNKIKISGAELTISQYEPTTRVINQIEEKLKKHNIPYEVRPSVDENGFNIPLSIIPNSSHEKLCISNGCVTIWNGHISRCPTLMYINYFNKHFDQKLPNEGIMPLDDSIEGWELIDRLNKKVPLCEYCVKNPVQWSVCGKKAELTDFAILD